MQREQTQISQLFEEVCKQQIQKTSILTDIRVVQAKNDDVQGDASGENGNGMDLTYSLET